MSQLMAVNEHPFERILRVVLGLTLIGLAFSGGIGAWGYIGVVPLLTGIIGSCPLYSVFGFSTCPTGTRRTSH